MRMKQPPHRLFWALEKMDSGLWRKTLGHFQAASLCEGTCGGRASGGYRNTGL